MESVRYLAGLPSTLLVDERFFAVHGALHPEPNDDLHLSSDLRVLCSMRELATGRFGSKICFFGHTHRPAIYEYRDGGLLRIAATTFVLRADAHYLVNPGSVGQSRDGDWRAGYATFDSESRRLELRRVEYDAASVERRSIACGLIEPETPLSRLARWFEG